MLLIWVSNILSPYETNTTTGIVQILLHDYYHCHMMSSPVIKDVEHILGECMSLCSVNCLCDVSWHVSNMSSFHNMACFDTCSVDISGINIVFHKGKCTISIQDVDGKFEKMIAKLNDLMDSDKEIHAGASFHGVTLDEHKAILYQ